jgi:ABC-type branched-subunit amino acid transport system ATPase component/ABC-type branched-subunit amino acid transport system permease subunit
MKIKEKQQSPLLWQSYLSIVLVCVAGILISYLIGQNRYIQRILILILLWAAASSAFNIISGYGGQIVFGYMMFMGTGAYTTVLLFRFLGVSPWLGMWVGAILAVIVAFIIGFPTLRLRGAYFAVATVAFPLMTIPLLNYIGLEEVNIPFKRGISLMQFTDMRFYVLIAAVFLAIVLIIVQKTERSVFGFRLRALKQNETAAEGMGINTHKVKLLAFMLSAALGAIIGTIYAFSILYVLTSPAIFGLFIIVRILSITIVGGLATLWGPFIGAAILVPIGEILNSQVGDRYPGVQDFIYGAALVAAIIYMPEGIWGKIQYAFGHLFQKSTSAVIPAAVKILDRSRSDNQKGSESFKSETFRPNIVETNGQRPVIKIENVHKSFGGVTALSNVSFEVTQGKILGVIGPNGAGKTTLFNVINGYLTPEKGKIFFEGREVTRLEPHSLCKLGIGRTYQTPQIFNKMTMLENILIGSFVKETKIAKAYAIAEKVSQQMGLSGRASDQAVGLSIWETKILELSRALATQPMLLLVDEPMAGLNPEEADHIGVIIKAIAKSGITVIVIEHVVQSLVKIADRMVGLDEGRKVAEGTPEEVTSNPHIIEAYLGAKWRERYAKR